MTFDIVCALWFASGGVNSMISALNVAYRVREGRSWFEVRTLALGLTLLISILLLAALFFVLVSSHLVEWLATDFRLQTDGRPPLEGHSVAGCYRFRYHVVFGNLLLRSRFGRATLALDNSRFGNWCVSMVTGFGRIPHLSEVF